MTTAPLPRGRRWIALVAALSTGGFVAGCADDAASTVSTSERRVTAVDAFVDPDDPTLLHIRVEAGDARCHGARIALGTREVIWRDMLQLDAGLMAARSALQQRKGLTSARHDPREVIADPTPATSARN